METSTKYRKAALLLVLGLTTLIFSISILYWIITLLVPHGPYMSEAFGTVAFVSGIIVPIIVAFIQRGDRIASEGKIERAEAEVIKAPEKAKPAWDLARATLEAYFNRNLAQINWIFWLSIVVMAAGFGIIIWGISKAIDTNLSGNHDPTTAQNLKMYPAFLAAIAGIITEFIGATFLFVYRSTIQQAANYSKTLERINSAGMAMQILDTIPDNADKNDLKSSTKAKLVELLVLGAHEQRQIYDDHEQRTKKVMRRPKKEN